MRGNNLMVGFENDTPFDDDGFPAEVCVDDMITKKARIYVPMKTADLKERRTARSGARFYCGGCGRQLKAEYYYNFSETYNYCPTCGARVTVRGVRS